jgi:two-component system CheB/CheR fusion protein
VLQIDLVDKESDRDQCLGMRQPHTPKARGVGVSATPESIDSVTPFEGVRPDSGRHVIVGIGASAGGLQAFRSFFGAMPDDIGMAFVLVQHLDPNYASALAEIVGEFTTMPVVKAVDGTVAAANTVSVIPPNAILKIENGILRVAKPESTTARRSSIDTFLASLAKDQGDRAVGIILSGFGSDGTIGIAAIKEAGGLTLSQAEFDHQAKAGMPESAVAGGFVDNVLQPQEMPERLQEHLTFLARLTDDPIGIAETTDSGDALTTICSVLHSRLGRDFGQYKRSTLRRRVYRRMHALRIDDINLYIEELRKLPDEPELLFREILIGVTRFFRDPEIFSTLAKTVLPELLTSGDPREPLRVWVAGCATGEEAYSLAILFKEVFEATEFSRPVTIFATDVDDRAVNFARAGLYPDIIEADISSERLERHFTRESNRYRVAKHIREMCVFSAHDLVKDPAFSKLNMISCRNLLIYFEPSLQQRVITTFHYALRTDGVLWLGPSESISTHAKLFKALDKRRRIFGRLPALVASPRLPPSRGSSAIMQPSDTSDTQGLDAQAARIAAQLAPAYIVVDGQSEIQRFSGPIAKFLEPMTGSASFNLFRMLHTDLRVPCRALLRKVVEGEGRVQELASLTIGGRTEELNLIAEAVGEGPGGQTFVLIAFQELPQVLQKRLERGASGDSSPSNSELLETRERLQTISEELETANEELQSSNEEFQSVNEELHSTVEELETSKEELQSMNEELHTVNAELSNRAENLSRSNSDLANLFDSTSIATLFLDNRLCIRRFTPAVTEIFNLRPGDEGRPLTELASRLAGDDLPRDVENVFRNLGQVEREVESEDGSSTFLLRVKPYRDLSNVIDGVVITLVDISERKKLDRDRARLAAIVEFSDDAIISHDLNGSITSWNAGAERMFGYSSQDIVGNPMATLLADDQADEWPATLNRLRAGEVISSLDVNRTTQKGRQIHASLKISPIQNAEGTIVGASAVARDIAERVEAQQRANLLLAELDHRVKNILAVVSAVVMQSLKSDAALSDTKREIEGRITAIARAHGLLQAHKGVEGSLEAIVRTELAPYEQGNFTINGDSVVLTSKSTLIFALAIHELATNAAKYGSLSTPSGRLAVTWKVRNEPSGSTLEIDWLETGGPPVRAPARRGFGTRLIEQSLERGLSAKVERDFLESGVRCSIHLPFPQDVGRLHGT